MVDSSSPATDAIKLSNEIIRASAGTGKTFALSNRYLQLLVSGVDCHSILATTFSRKGAGEILDRIIHRLSDAALDAQAAQTLSQFLNVGLTQDQAADILRQLLRNLHRLEISTLDSFFNRVAKAFSLEIGLPPNWEIVDEQKIAELEDDSIQQVLQDESVINLLHMLSKGEASRRVASMIRDTVRNAYLFYRESGPDAWDRLELPGQYLNDEQIARLVEQMHAIVPEKKSLAKHWQVLLQVIAEADWNTFIEQTSFKNFMSGKLKYGRTNLTPDIVSIFGQLLPHCQAVVGQQVIEANRSTRDLLQPFGELLEQLKDANGSLRFDDVTERLQAFVRNCNTDHFSFRLDNQIQHLLLDEFQDTSPSQWNVIEPFARNVVAESKSNQSFFCVGDMKQAIFGWRGGVAEIFDVVQESLPNLNAQKLAKSYRSSPVVIDLVNRVFGGVQQYSCDDALIDSAVHGWADWFSQHSTDRTQLPGHATLEMAPECNANARSLEERKDQQRNRNLVEYTVQRVCQLDRDLPADKTIGILVRRNKEVTQLIAKLREQGIQASEEGGSQLTDSVGVQLILSALQLSDHPGDGLARFHISQSPLAEVFGLQPENDTNSHSNREAAQVGAATLRWRLTNEGYGPVIESLARQLIDHATRRETTRLQQLVRAAYDRPSDPQGELRPSNFVNFIRDEYKVSEQNSARVRVMTIHRSKGLEFDTVVLPYQLSSRGWAGLTPQVVVGRQSPTDPIDIASRYVGATRRAFLPQEFQQIFEDDRQQSVREAMCVLYVMLTRAKHAIHIFVSHGAKADHKSPAGVLMATLADGRREEGVLFENGKPDWHADCEAEPEAIDRYGLQRHYLPTPIRFQASSVSRDLKSKRGLPRILPSLASQGEQIDLDQVFESWSNIDSFQRGQLLHGCFEKLNWIDDHLPSRDALHQHLQEIAPAADNLAAILDRFYQMLDQPAVRNLFSKNGYVSHYRSPQADDTTTGSIRVAVQTERRFAVATSAGFLQGVIDRLVLIYRDNQLIAADVIDLKTDQINQSQLHKRINRHRPQLEAYRTAAAKFLKLPVEQISSRLVFVETGQVVNVHAIDGAIDYSAKKKRPATNISAPKRKPQPSSKPQESPDAAASTKAEKQASEEKQSSTSDAPTSDAPSSDAPPRATARNRPSPDPGSQVQRELWD